MAPEKRAKRGRSDPGQASQRYMRMERSLRQIKVSRQQPIVHPLVKGKKMRMPRAHPRPKNRGTHTSKIPNPFDMKEKGRNAQSRQPLT